MSLSDALGLAIPLSIISPPVALIVAAVTIGIVTITGLQTAPEKSDSRENISSEPPTHKNLLQRLLTLGRTVVFFGKTAFKDPDYMLPAGALGAGALVFAQACLGISFLVTAPPVIAAAGIAGCAALGAFGLYVMQISASGRWRSLKDIYSKTFHKNQPLAHEKKTAQNFLRKLKEQPLIRGFIQKPLVQKYLHSRVGKFIHTPTQRQKDLMMLAPSFPGTLFVSAAASLMMIKYAISALTIGAAAIPPLLVAAWWGSGPFVNLYPQTKILLRSLRRKKPAQPDAPAVHKDELVVTEGSPSFDGIKPLKREFAIASAAKTKISEDSNKPPRQEKSSHPNL